MKRSFAFAAVAVAVSLSLCGCPAPQPSNNELTAAQQAAVNSVVGQLDAFSAVLGTFAPLGNSQLNLDNIGVIGSFGTCPQVSFVRSETTAIININFGAGCSGPATAGKTVSGALNVNVTRQSRSAVFQFVSLTVDGHSISGTASATLAPTADGVTLTGTCDITTGAGEVSGNFTAHITSTGVLTLDAQNLLFASAAATYQVTLASVVIDPTGNGNFVPESGSASVTVPNESGAGTVTLTITFSSQTPVNGTVQVTVGSGRAITYQIPGVP